MHSFPDNAYVQDLIAPVRVEHRVEFGDRQGEGRDESEYGHYYNYLLYAFAKGAAVAEAVHYFDEEKVTLRLLDPPDFSGTFALKVLVFLAMRYDQIDVMRDGKLVAADDASLARVQDAKWRHMRGEVP